MWCNCQPYNLLPQPAGRNHYHQQGKNPCSVAAAGAATTATEVIERAARHVMKQGNRHAPIESHLRIIDTTQVRIYGFVQIRQGLHVARDWSTALDQ